MTKERPILFSTPMVEAILDGRKTQTRRARGLEEINKNPDDWLPIKFRYIRSGKAWIVFHNSQNVFFDIPCPYGKPGDRLWVRETFTVKTPVMGFEAQDWASYGYKASGYTLCFGEKWKPSIHMPEKAARIWLEITDISVERLQDISKEDAIAEGIEPVADGYKNYMPKLSSTSQFCWPTAYHSFQSLWESINGTESWDLNPWLWVIKFKVLSTTSHPHTPNPYLIK